jgi:hypothetical protein
MLYYTIIIFHHNVLLFFTYNAVKSKIIRIENHNRRRCIFKTSERTRTIVEPLTYTGLDKD